MIYSDYSAEKLIANKMIWIHEYDPIRRKQFVAFDVVKSVRLCFEAVSIPNPYVCSSVAFYAKSDE